MIFNAVILYLMNLNRGTTFTRITNHSLDNCSWCIIDHHGIQAVHKFECSVIDYASIVYTLHPSKGNATQIIIWFAVAVLMCDAGCFVWEKNCSERAASQRSRENVCPQHKGYCASSFTSRRTIENCLMSARNIRAAAHALRSQRTLNTQILNSKSTDFKLSTDRWRRWQ